MKTRKGARVKTKRADDSGCSRQSIPIIGVFSNHPQIGALGPVFAAKPHAFRDSFMRDIVPSPRIVSSRIEFPPKGEMEKALGSHILRSIPDGDSVISPILLQQATEDMVHVAIPGEWIRSVKRATSDPVCSAERSLAHLSVCPRLHVHGLRHAYAHSGGWSLLKEDDRIRVAYAILERLRAPDRIRFAHVERLEHRLELISEYWSELLAFAFGVVAKDETEWKRSFLARAVQRSAGAPLAYPMSETGERDLQLVRWYLDRTNLGEPWTYASNAQEWLRQTVRKDRIERIRHAISGLPPGNMRMVFSILIESDAVPSKPERVIARAHLSAPPHLASWIERACELADRVVSPEAEEETESLFAGFASLAAEWDLFSDTDQHRTVQMMQRYLHDLVNTL